MTPEKPQTEIFFFFRYYEVRQKNSNAKKVVDDIHKFITDNFDGESGIIYCFSKKDSQELADQLNEKGIYYYFFIFLSFIFLIKLF